MKTRILTRKRLIFVEVQAEGSRQLQPFSRTSPRTLPSLILQLEPLYISPLMVCGHGMKERMNESGMPLGDVRGAPFIAQGGRFPRESNMRTLGTAFGRIRATFPPKFGPFGAKVGLTFHSAITRNRGVPSNDARNAVLVCLNVYIKICKCTDIPLQHFTRKYSGYRYLYFPKGWRSV